MDRLPVDYSKFEFEKARFRVQTHSPTAEIPKRNEDSPSDVTYSVSLIARVDQHEDNVQDTTKFETGISIGMPPGYYAMITAAPSLVDAGYMLPSPIIINPTNHEPITVTLFKFKEAADLELPYSALELTLHRACYMYHAQVSSMEASGPMGDLVVGRSHLRQPKQHAQPARLMLDDAPAPQQPRRRGPLTH